MSLSQARKANEAGVQTVCKGKMTELDVERDSKHDAAIANRIHFRVFLGESRRREI